MLQKVRINDLARELEVKSKVILDLLIKVGVTEKKTHSSSIEVDEAELVKKYYTEHGEPGSSTSSRSSRTPAEEFKPKIDLSHVSKPPAVSASAATVAPAETPKPAPRFITPQSVARPPATITIPSKTAAVPPATTPAPTAKEPAKLVEPRAEEKVSVAVDATPEVAEPDVELTSAEVLIAPSATSEEASSVAAAPAATVVPTPAKPAGSTHRPAPPVRRMIVPQTGPRPVYACLL